MHDTSRQGSVLMLWWMRVWRLLVGTPVLVWVLLVACSTPAGPGLTSSAPPQRIEVTYSAGAVQGGVSRIPVELGRMVQLVVHSDVPDEVHVHGYDYLIEVPTNGSATVEFVADRSGVFEVELESSGTQLAQLEVR